MTPTEFANKYKNSQLREIARDIAGSVVIRTYVDGNSKDTRRETTPEEKEIIRNVAYAAMIAYLHRTETDINAILDMAEFTLMQFIENVNTYDSIYIPLRKITQTGLWAA